MPDSVFSRLSEELRQSLAAEENVEEKVQDLLVETAAVVSTYNMVSRFLVSLDIAGKLDEQVPWPVDREEVRPSSTTQFITLYINIAYCYHSTPY